MRKVSGLCKGPQKKPLNGSAGSKIILLISLVVAFTSISGLVSAAVSNYTESYGPSRYGWHQVYSNGTTEGVVARLTGSADRQYYDYGYKPIQIYARLEDYWARDCGWWYVSDTKGVNITLKDGSGKIVNASSSYIVTQKGRVEVSYNWGSSFSNTTPGRWNVTVKPNTIGPDYAWFYLYVRGQLNVTSITSSSSPSAGNIVKVNATIKDNVGNLVKNNSQDNAGSYTKPTITLYVTGAGEELVLTMADNGTNGDVVANDGIWAAQFTPQRPGDHMLVVDASDGHNFWVDGRKSGWLYVTGNFPYASLGLYFFDYLRVSRLEGAGFVLPTFLVALVGGVFIKRRWRVY